MPLPQSNYLAKCEKVFAIQGILFWIKDAGTDYYWGQKGKIHHPICVQHPWHLYFILCIN